MSAGEDPRGHDMSEKAYLLWFVQEQDVAADIELLIGVFATDTDARATIDRLKNKPGFVDFPEGFQIHVSEIGKNNWEDGFVKTD